MTSQDHSLSNSHSGSREQFTATFLLLAVAFCVCLIVANLMEIKTVDLGRMTITAGVAVFPLSYIINDCLVEIYGLRKATFVIVLGFLMNLLTVIFLQIGLWLPGTADWSGQQAMELIFGATPRILLASFTAFLAGSLTNALIMARMKKRSRSLSKRRFSLRAILSTLGGEGIDSLIFFPMAFSGILMPDVIMTLIITQTLLKTAYEIVVLPLTVVLVSYLRRHECSAPQLPRTQTAP